MLRFYALCLLFCGYHALFAQQRNLEIGVMSGVTHYYGDLGNIHGPMQWNSTRPGMTITFRDFLNNPKRYVTRSLTTEARLSWFRIGYDERDMIKGVAVEDLKNYRRGLSFRNDLIGASGHLVLNAYREPFQPLYQQRFFMTFQIGFGVYHGRPKADLFNGDIDIANRYHFWSDGTVRDAPRGTQGANIIERDGKYETDLYSWMTESSNGSGEFQRKQKVSPWHVAVPMGVGIRYMLSKELSIGMEYCYMMFTTDLLDDVSDRYATYAEIDAAYPGDPVKQELARYISDPTGWGTDGSDEGLASSPRGNPGLLDSFSFVSLEVSYKFKRKPSRRTYVSL
jgi:hypothetical protein